MKTVAIIGLLVGSILKTQAFTVHANTEILELSSPPKSRRDIIQSLFQSVVGVSCSIPFFHQAAYASGGATAGGAYLISAKQRYNARVRDGIKQFVLLSNDLEKSDLQSTQYFFSSDAVGSWKDTSVAGYLLANAFRTSSAKPPDSLPSVKVCIGLRGFMTVIIIETDSQLFICFRNGRHLLLR
jgi:hypothetical protein